MVEDSTNSTENSSLSMMERNCGVEDWIVSFPYDSEMYCHSLHLRYLQYILPSLHQLRPLLLSLSQFRLREHKPLIYSTRSISSPPLLWDPEKCFWVITSLLFPTNSIIWPWGTTIIRRPIKHASLTHPRFQPTDILSLSESQCFCHRWLVWNSGVQKSRASFTELMNIIHDPEFQLEDIQNVKWDQIDGKLALGQWGMVGWGCRVDTNAHHNLSSLSESPWGPFHASCWATELCGWRSVSQRLSLHHSGEGS